MFLRETRLAVGVMVKDEGRGGGCAMMELE